MDARRMAVEEGGEGGLVTTQRPRHQFGVARGGGRRRVHRLAIRGRVQVRHVRPFRKVLQPRVGSRSAGSGRCIDHLRHRVNHISLQLYRQDEEGTCATHPRIRTKPTPFVALFLAAALRPRDAAGLRHQYHLLWDLTVGGVTPPDFANNIIKTWFSTGAFQLDSLNSRKQYVAAISHCGGPFRSYCRFKTVKSD